jgi:hypothetical protein
MPGLFDSSDDDNFVVGPTLDQRVIDGVMEKIRTERTGWDLDLQTQVNAQQEKTDKKLQKMMIFIVHSAENKPTKRLSLNRECLLPSDR